MTFAIIVVSLLALALLGAVGWLCWLMSQANEKHADQMTRLVEASAERHAQANENALRVAPAIIARRVDDVSHNELEALSIPKRVAEAQEPMSTEASEANRAAAKERVRAAQAATDPATQDLVALHGRASFGEFAGFGTSSNGAAAKE